MGTAILVGRRVHATGVAAAMLDVMRSNAKSSLIVLIFGAIIVTFIFSFGRGSSGFRTRTPETWAARVNGEMVTASDFTQAYTSRFRQMSQVRGGKYTTDNARQDNLKQETLKALIDQELIAQQADDLGIQVSDDEVADAIAKNPNFQQDGKFDFDYYKRLVENGYGMSIKRFEDAYRRDLLRGKVIQAAVAGAHVSDDEVKAAWQAQHEGAAITYVRFNAFMFRDKAAASDAEAEEFAKAHGDEIAKKYEEEKATRYTQPAAVKVRAITIPVPPSATAEQEKAAREKIDAAAAEVKAGKDFAEVAKARSEDAATKANGGELGFVARGQSPFGKTLEDEAQKLKPGQVSDVFKDRSGFHLLKAEEERPAREQTLDEVRKQIAVDLVRGQKARELAKQKAEETLAQLRSGKELKDLFPQKKTEPGQFDFTSFTTPQTSETETFHPMGGYIPGIGEAPRLSEAVFAQTRAGAIPQAPVDEGDTWYVFKVKSRERADPSKMDPAELSSLRDRLTNQKQGELYGRWVDNLRSKSKIVENQQVLSYEQGPAGEALAPDDF
ncbi:MAG TPA: SurA N-terminal domain-containing protein [Myxococcales bacterium]|nr:SurA N-terminal domain-containing protein [Myxococcales bacterium]